MTGCLSPKTRYTDIGNVSARARLQEGIASYYQIEISRPTDALAPRIWLRLPNGKIIDRTWFTYTALKQAGFVGFDERDNQPGNNYSHELKRYGASFLFDNGTLIMLRLSQTTGDVVGISREHGKQFKSLPLSQEELEQLFGHPDRISDKSRL
jgi:hypothetical protein